jgi:DNA polymerase III alpha subunit (gram-positive type)
MTLPYFVAFDLETGGTDEKKNSILTGYFAVLDKDLTLIEDLELYFNPPEGLTTEEGALKANGIDLEKHLSRADLVTYKQGAEKIADLLVRNKPKRSKLRPMGYNIGFDIRFINQNLIQAESWDGLVHYAMADAFNVVNFLKDIDFVPQEVGSLGSVVKHFGLNEGLYHTAKDDVKMSVEVYRKLREMISNLRNNNGAQALDLLEIIE